MSRQTDYQRQAAADAAWFADAEQQAAERRQRDVTERVAQVLAMSPREHIEGAAELQSTPIGADHAMARQAAIQTELLWAQTKQTPAWTDSQSSGDEACDEA